ncbi:MAG: DUF47 family protein [Acidobacteriota bacterium]|nr:DUF47 family protein [Acidobacteriota bacterium]MDQ7087980.1 DUF47 family protein [Acidobacteriota bacterium]
MILFGKTRRLEMRVDEFFDAVSEGALIFARGVGHYLAGEEQAFAADLEAVRGAEQRADVLRREVENQLYSHALIPDQRGDVLGLLESSDDVIDEAYSALAHLDVERPRIDDAERADFTELARAGAASVEALVLAARAFFRDVGAVKDHLHKVYFYEKESDQISLRLRRRIFASSLELAVKLHLAGFVERLARVSDRAESVADRIAIYAVKRSV